LADQLGVGRIENEFASLTTDRTAFVQALPLDIATGHPLIMKLTYFGTIAGILGDDVDWVIRWAVSSSARGSDVFETTGDAPGSAPGQRTLTRTTDVGSISPNQQIEEIFELEIPDAIAQRENAEGDKLWVSIERNSSSTYLGNVVMIDLEVDYLAWRNGGLV
jgi:hypothetical protein